MNSGYEFPKHAGRRGFRGHGRPGGGAGRPGGGSEARRGPVGPPAYCSDMIRSNSTMGLTGTSSLRVTVTVWMVAVHLKGAS